MDKPPPIPENMPKNLISLLNEKGLVFGIFSIIVIPALIIVLLVIVKGAGFLSGVFVGGIQEGTGSLFAPPFAYEFSVIEKLDFRPFGGEIENVISIKLINQTQAQTSVYCSLLRDNKKIYRKLVTVPGNGHTYFDGNSDHLYSKNPNDWEDLIFSGDVILIEKNSHSKIELKVPE